MLPYGQLIIPFIISWKFRLNTISHSWDTSFVQSASTSSVYYYFLFIFLFKTPLNIPWKVHLNTLRIFDSMGQNAIFNITNTIFK